MNILRPLLCIAQAYDGWYCDNVVLNIVMQWTVVEYTDVNLIIYPVI